MFSSRTTKKRVLVALSVIGVLAIAVAAFAYWTISGSGSGSATAGDTAGLTVSGDPDSGIFPGGDVAVTTTITNGSDTTSAHVGYLHVSISTSDANCDPSWFTYKADDEAAAVDASNPHTVALDADIAASGSKLVAGKVFMSNEDLSQDACKNATLTLDYGVDNDA